MTRRADGAPQASPVTAGVDDAGRIVISTYPERAKVVNVRRDPRVSVLVLSDDFGGAWVQVDGESQGARPARVGRAACRVLPMHLRRAPRLGRVPRGDGRAGQVPDPGQPDPLVADRQRGPQRAWPADSSRRPTGARRRRVAAMLHMRLSGGIGSGSRRFGATASHRAVLVDADQLAREVVAPGSDGLAGASTVRPGHARGTAASTGPRWAASSSPTRGPSRPGGNHPPGDRGAHGAALRAPARTGSSSTTCRCWSRGLGAVPPLVVVGAAEGGGCGGW